MSPKYWEDDIDFAPPNFLRASLFSEGKGSTFFVLLCLPCFLIEYSLFQLSSALFSFFAGFILSQSFLITSILDGVQDVFELLIESSKSKKSSLEIWKFLKKKYIY